MRLLNPKNYYSDDTLLNLPIIEHNGNNYRVLVRDESYRTPTGCQCFKDCNCAEDYGKWIEKSTTYYRNVLNDNTDKAFYKDIDYLPIKYNLINRLVV
jgi:hypothetical protein